MKIITLLFGRLGYTMAMNIVVFGASGNVGRLVVEKLLAAGHSVTVFVHQTNVFEVGDRLKVIKSDVHNAAFVESAVRGQDAVISTLGSWHTPTKDILSAAMRFIIPAMEQAGISRIITLTGSAAWVPDEQHSTADALQHKLMSLVAKDVLRDGETHAQLLAESSLNYTVIRAPIMRNGQSGYRLDAKLPKAWERISRDAVAQAIVDQLQDDTWSKNAPHIHPA